MRCALFALAIIVVGTPSSHSQGTVNFANGGAGVNAPAYFVGPPPRSPLAGPEYAAQLFYGGTGDWVGNGSYTPLAGVVPFQSGVNAGYFFGGSRTLPVPAGTTINIIVAFFSGFYGPDYFTATANFGPTGYSRPLAVTLGGWLGGLFPPPNLVGLETLYVQQIPEPSEMAFIIVGGFCLLLNRLKWQAGDRR